MYSKSTKVEAGVKYNKPELNWVGFRGQPTVELRVTLMDDSPWIIRLRESRSGIGFIGDINKRVYVYQSK